MKSLVQMRRAGQKEGKDGARQMCHTTVFSGVKELVKTVLTGKKKTTFLFGNCVLEVCKMT